MLKKKINENTQEVVTEYYKKWEKFLAGISKIVDPVLYSILSVSDFKGFDDKKGMVTILVYKKFIMFQDLFIEQKKYYQSVLELVFGYQTVLFVDFSKIETKSKVESQAKNVQEPMQEKTSFKQASKKIVISDDGTWGLAQALLKHFGGTITEIIKETHEPDA